MDIRKHIIFLCLLCCHALGVMADDHLVHNYKSIRPDLAQKFFAFTDSRITVTGVSYGDYKPVGSSKVWIAQPTESNKRSFALKVKCSDSFKFSFEINELIPSQETSNEPTNEHTLIVDGQVKVQTKVENKSLSESISFELSAGEHEIIIMSNFIGGSKHPHAILLKYMCLHAHIMGKEHRRPAYCGQDGFIRRSCLARSCDYREVVTIPMPATTHRSVIKTEMKGSCRTPMYVWEICNICRSYVVRAKTPTVWAHVFENGQCVNKGCGIKLPVQNAAGVYQVGDAYELRGLAEQIQAENISRACNIDLTADIIFPKDLEHLPIGSFDFPFAGTFDGHGHRIVGMQTPPSSDMTGLFGMVAGTPRHPAVIANVIIDSTSNVRGKGMVGAIAGRADYCDIMRCVSQASVSGNNLVGGLVGYSASECHLIDCAMQGVSETLWKDGALLSGLLRQSYIMDSYSMGSSAKTTSPALAPSSDILLRHCFQLDAKDPMTGVTSFSSAQMSDGTLARMLCEKKGNDMPAHWMQDATTGCPMPIFVALTDRPAPVIQSQAAEGTMNDDPSIVLTASSDYQEEEEEWFSFSPDSDLEEESSVEDIVFYDETDSTMNDFICYVSTTYRNVPAMPMFAPMEGGDAKNCEVTYCKRDSSVIMEYNYTMDSGRFSLIDATKQYTTPDSVVHVERYIMEGDENDGEFLLKSNAIYSPNHSGYEEEVSHGVATRVMDWEVLQVEGSEPTLNYYVYDENGQERIDGFSIPLSDMEDKGDDFVLPVDMDYTLDEYGRMINLHYVLTDSLTGEQYIIGGEYYIYDELGEQVQIVSYEPVAPHSSEMRQTEYTTIQIYRHEDDPTSIIPIEHLQPNTLAGTPTRISSHVYDLRGNLVRPNNDPASLRSLPKGIYITRGKKFMVR